MKSTIEKVKEVLIGAFPHWSQWDVDGLASFLMAFFKEEIKKDDSYVVAATSELYSYFEEKVIGQGKIEKRDVRPGLVVHYLNRYPSFTMKLKGLYKNKSLMESYNQRCQEVEATTEIEAAYTQHLEFVSLDAIKEFIKRIDAAVPFTKSHAPVWAIMREVANELEGAPLEYFWIMVKERCLEGGVANNPEQWRQMKKRILDRINSQAKGAQGMLGMVSVSAEERALRKLLNVLERLDEKSKNFMNTDLEERTITEEGMITQQGNSAKKAYQFSKMELDGMIKLRKLFLENRYTTERFPEVYEGEIPVRAKEEHELIDLGSDGIFELVKKSWMDALGIYRFGPYKNEDYNYEFTTEGIIIIDSKKIEQWVDIWNRNSSEELTVDDVRFVVLMHELGHWFSHWASRNVEDADLLQWNPGFHFPNRMTKEALANIICFWACQDVDLDEEQRKGVLKALDALTPKDEDGNVDTSNAYGAYELLKPFERSPILEKLNTLRANWMLKDELLFDLLQSSAKDVFEWLGERQPEIVSIEDFKGNPELQHKSVWDKGEIRKGSSILGRNGVLAGKRPN